MSLAEKLIAIAENEQKVYDAGFAAGEATGGGDGSYYDTFWDNFQNFGNRTDYRYGFAGAGWNEETFKPKYVIKPAPFTSSGIFQYAAVTTVKNVDMSQVSNYATSWFANCANLHTVENLILPNAMPSNNLYSGLFTNCTALVNFSCVGEIGNNGFDVHWSPLSVESLVGILAALKNYAGSGATYTVTLGETNLAKLTDAEKAVATEKGWTLV